MGNILKVIVGGALLVAGAAVAWFFIGLWIKTRWPARIPPEHCFEHQLHSGLKLRKIAEALAERFRDFNGDDVVCLGPVRGNAARILFHAGPKNSGPNKNIHRHDYVLHVERLGKEQVILRLDTNRPYSYYRIARSEVEVLSQTLVRAFGDLTTI